MLASEKAVASHALLSSFERLPYATIKETTTLATERMVASHGTTKYLPWTFAREQDVRTIEKRVYSL